MSFSRTSGGCRREGRVTELGIRIIIAVNLLMIFVIVFSGAWAWMTRCERMSKELEKVRRQLQEAREDACEWREVAEHLAQAIEGRTA